MNIHKTNVTSNLLSRFWSRTKLSNVNIDKFKNYVGSGSNIQRIHELSQLKTGISNFVRIIAKKNIPVVFNTESEASYTDFKTVVIAANLKEDNFDIMCGLAMHEGSHIRYTDKNYLLDILGLDEKGEYNGNVENFGDIKYIYDNMVNDKIKKLAIKKKFMVENITDEDKNFYAGVMKFFITWVKDLANWVEDRRIDKLVYTSAPGYKGYYTALYNYYFFNKEITDGMKSDFGTTEEFSSYSYRIINSINEEHREDVLNGLPEIMKLIDMDNIERLDGIKASFDIARKILEIVLENVDELDKEEVEKQMAENSGGEDGEIDYDNLDLSNVQLGNEGKGKELDLDKLSDKQLKDLLNAIKEQKDLINGKTEKESMEAKDADNVSAISNKSLNIVPVDTALERDKKSGELSKHVTQRDSSTYWNDDTYDGTIYDVVVLNNVTYDTFFNDNIFPFSRQYENYTDQVASGIRAGKKLGNKLLIRNDERVTEYSRKTSGRIDKRLLSDLGFGGESIFTQRVMETYTNSILHISIDGSGSMSGGKLGQCVQLATTVCIAADMIDNLEVVVSMRGSRDNDPFIAVVYDSRKDAIKKVKKLFPHLDTSGVTPEGLCFSAIQEQIEKTSGTLKSYFINLSDGEPYFWGYSGRSARLHTRQEIQKMVLKKVRILSYYISSGGWGGSMDDFTEMYGKYGSNIDVNSIGQISKTLNKLFLEK